jgi:WD40 repeat protein
MRPAFSPDGAAIAAAGRDGTVRVWSVASGAPAATIGLLRGHTGPVSYDAFSPDGKELISGGDTTLRAWDVATGEGRVLVTAPSIPVRPHYSPDGRWIIYGQGFNSIGLYDRQKKAPGCELKGKNLVSTPVFTPDSREVVFSGEDVVLAGDPETCAIRELFKHGAIVDSVAVSGDGAYIAAAGGDGPIALYARQGGQARRLVGHTMQVYSVAFSPDSKTLASSSFDGTARLWQVPDGAPLKILRGHQKAVGVLAFTPDGRTLVSSSLDNTMRVWDTATGDSAVLRGHDDMIWGMTISPDGKLVASSSKDGTLRLWPIDASGGLPHEAPQIIDWIHTVTTARIDAKNRVATP